METFILETQKFAAGGNCIGYLNGKTVFVPYAVPGETLEVEIIKKFSDYDTARIKKILKPSVYRTEPFCPLYGKCGGCNMMHIKTEFQRELRAEILKNSFLREGINLDSVEFKTIYGSEKNYRARIQLNSGGFQEKGENADETVKIDACPVLTESLNEYLSRIPYEKRPQGRIHMFGDERLVPVKNKTDSGKSEFSKIVIEKKTEKQKYESVIKARGGRKNKIIKNKVKNRFQGTTFDEENSCTVNILGKEIKFNVQGFFQSNMELLEKTIPLVTENLSGKTVLDMYAGTGTFSVFLAEKFEKTVLVEHNRDALAYAEINMNGTTHESYGISGENFVQTSNTEFDAVVIDPPRSGMEKKVSDWLCEKKIPVIRSVSCDAATHARDAKKLIDAGYSLEKLYLLDFYPQTSHIESLAFFRYN